MKFKVWVTRSKQAVVEMEKCPVCDGRKFIMASRAIYKNNNRRTCSRCKREVLDAE